MSGILSVAKGRLSGVSSVGGECIVVVSVGGVLRKKRILPGRKIIDDGVISYSRDCYVFDSGNLEIGAEVRYDVRHQ